MDVNIPHASPPVYPQIDCYDHDDDGAHDFIGGFTTTLEEMMKPTSAKVKVHNYIKCFFFFHSVFLKVSSIETIEP